MKDQTTKQASASQKPNILVRLLALLVTAALALGALTLVVYRDQFNLDAVKRWLALRSVETDASGAAAPFTHAGGDSISFAYLKGGILQCSAAGAHYYSFSGDQYAEEVTPLSQPVLSASSSAGVVYDAGGESLFLFQDGQEAFSLDVDGTLLSARVNDSGWLAVTAQQSGYKGSVTVYNVNSTSRKEIIQLNFSSVFVADAAVSPDSKTVAVITIGQENGSFFSQLLLYPVDSSEPSATLSLGNLAVLDLDYEAEQLWVLGEDRLLSVAADGSDYETYSFGRSYLKAATWAGTASQCSCWAATRPAVPSRCSPSTPSASSSPRPPSGGRCSPSPPPGATCPCSPAAAWRSTPGTCPSTAPWRTPRTPASPPSPPTAAPCWPTASRPGSISPPEFPFLLIQARYFDVFCDF